MYTPLYPTRLSVAVSAALYVSLTLPATAVVSTTTDTDAITFDTVVVGQAPVSPLTYETDPKLPRQPVPASDGADYLKTIPGFTAIRNGGTNGDPILRGMFGSRLSILTNDGSMPGACPSRMDNSLSYISPETFDKLVVVKGPQTVLWGPGASAGTIRFERKTEPFKEPGSRITGSVLGGTLGRNDQALDATSGSPLGYVRLSANRSEADDYEDGKGDIVPSAWKKWNADIAFGWTPDTDTVVEFTAGTGDGEARYAGRGMDGAQFKRESYGLRFERNNFSGALDTIQANVFYNYADHVMDNYTLREPNPMSSMPMPVAANVDRQTKGGRFATIWSGNTWEITTGMDAQQSIHRERSAMGQNTYRDLPWSTDANFKNIGLFSEGTWKLDPQKRWVAGVRLDRTQVQDERETVGMMGMLNPTFGLARNESLPGGFIRFEQDISNTPVSWYAGLGRTKRMPDYWELFSADMGPMGALNAFDGINPEKTTQLDVGLQYQTTPLKAWVSAYAGQVDNFILFTYTTGGMMGTSSSVANVDAKIHGAEAGIEFKPNDHWKLGGTLAYAWGENRNSGEALPQMPPLEARLSAGYDNQRWSFGALLRAVSKQDRVAIDQGNVVGRDISPSAGFATFAVNADYRFSEKLSLTAGVDNVFNRLYSEHLNLAGSADFGYPANPVRINEPGRVAWVKLNLHY